MARRSRTQAVEELTEEQEIELKAHRSQMSKESRERKMAAIAQLITYIESAGDVPKEIINAIRRVRGETRQTGANSKRAIIIAYVIENGPVDEGYIFTEFKLGRAEMRLIINDAIKKVNDPEDRVWIAFDPESGMYTLDGTGAEPPINWRGYIPVEVQEYEE